MYKDNNKIEKLVLDLKSDSRFKTLKDKKMVGFWASGGVNYNEYTELESNNLKILYVKEVIWSAKHSDEITITDKRENVYAFCNSIFKESTFKDKPIKKTSFTVEELKEYIDKNA
jgi:hypothetical protein